MSETHKEPLESQQSAESTENNSDKKPGFFRKVFQGIKEVPKFVGKVIRGVDRTISRIPLAGEVYGIAKGVTKEVWHASEQVPFLGEVTKTLRHGAQDIFQEAQFTSEEKKQIDAHQNQLLGELRNIRNNIAQNMPESALKNDIVAFYDELLTRKNVTPEEAKNLLNSMAEKYPAMKPVFEQYMQANAQIKTGKENMSVDELVEDGRKIEKALLSYSDYEGKSPSEIQKNDFSALQKSFSNLPSYENLDKSSELYRFLQQAYFSRTPRPDLNNPVVKGMIEKRLTIHLAGGDATPSMRNDLQDFIYNNKDTIPVAFSFSDPEKTFFDYNLNHIEKSRRLPPTLPHEYSGPDYGMHDLWLAANRRLFPDKQFGHVENMEPDKVDTFISNYRGVLFSPFLGGH